MKNVPIVPLALLAAITALTSCSKSKYNNTDQLASLGKATITGKAYATLDATPTAPFPQYAPSGTKIKAWINSRDLVVGDTSGLRFYKKYAQEATIGASGKFTIEVEVSKYDSVWVTLEPQGFSASYKYKSGANTVTETRWFKAPEMPFKKMAINSTDTTATVYYMN